tara:strand:- start:153 stop:620 length:468 start_codon:yes stop_codon:yes gene_type:complete
MMDFIIFLSKLDKEIFELIKKVNYSIDENSALCLIDKKYVGFHKKREKKIIICTENVKNTTNFKKKPISKSNDNHKTKLYIRRALRHEATHMVQSCNGDKIIGDINELKKKINKSKEKAIKSSVRISGNLEKELEAYMMEDKPRKVKKAIIRYCL